MSRISISHAEVS